MRETIDMAFEIDGAMIRFVPGLPLVGHSRRNILRRLDT